MRDKTQSRSLSHRWTDSLDCWGLHLRRNRRRMDNIDPWIIVINTLAHFPDQHFPSFCLSEIWVTRNFRCIYHTAISGVRKNPQVPNPRSLSNSFSFKSWFIFLKSLYLAQIWPAAYWQDCCLQEGACVCEEHLDETQSQDKWRLLLKDKCKESIVGYQQAAAHCWSKGKHSCINGIIVKCMQEMYAKGQHGDVSMFRYTI